MNARLLCVFIFLGMFCFSLADTAQDNPTVPENKIGCTDSKEVMGSGGKTVTDEKYGTPEEAQLLLAEAFKYVQEKGFSAGCVEFSNPKGTFVFKDLYIFVIDLKGNVLAHGGDPKLVNTNQYNLKDSTGKFFIQQFISLMQTKSEAWMKYKWRNYDNQQIQSKVAFLKKVDNNTFMGCGSYLIK